MARSIKDDSGSFETGTAEARDASCTKAAKIVVVRCMVIWPQRGRASRAVNRCGEQLHVK